MEKHRDSEFTTYKLQSHIQTNAYKLWPETIIVSLELIENVTWILEAFLFDIHRNSGGMKGVGVFSTTV